MPGDLRAPPKQREPLGTSRDRYCNIIYNTLVPTCQARPSLAATQSAFTLRKCLSSTESELLVFGLRLNEYNRGFVLYIYEQRAVDRQAFPSDLNSFRHPPSCISMIYIQRGECKVWMLTLSAEYQEMSDLCVGLSPLPVTVTIRIITFLVTGRGDNPTYVKLMWYLCMASRFWSKRLTKSRCPETQACIRRFQP